MEVSLTQVEDPRIPSQISPILEPRRWVLCPATVASSLWSLPRGRTLVDLTRIATEPWELAIPLFYHTFSYCGTIHPGLFEELGQHLKDPTN
jgi:hypothetical protein